MLLELRGSGGGEGRVEVDAAAEGVRPLERERFAEAEDGATLRKEDVCECG